MAKLVVNPGTAEAWGIELNEGANSIGRGADNDFPIDHDSVSASHCEVVVEPGGAILRDLGSTAGTYVDNELVEECKLQPGQTIRLGEIVLRFESDQAALVTAGAAPAEPAGERVMCKFHPKAVARYACPQCGNSYCDLCVDRRAGRGRQTFCRACGALCTRLKVRLTIEPVERPGLARSIGLAFAYPFKGDGPVLLVVGTVFYLVLGWVARMWGILGALLIGFGTCYLLAYYHRILLSSASDDDSMPDWPDLTAPSDVLWPVLYFAGTAAFSFAPAIGLAVFGPRDTSWFPWTAGGLAVLGCCYFPIALTAVTLADSLTALNPLVIVPSIFRIFGDYFVVILVSVVIFGGSLLLPRLLAAKLPVPVLFPLLAEFTGLYLATVGMRLLGQTYWRNREKLGWFTR